MTDAFALPTRALVRASAPLSWRGSARVARRLMHFSATEAGSARDLFRAVELVREPTLRRQLMQHALDEDRHARLFAAAARRLDPSASHGAYDAVHARRADLLERHGLVSFMAFIMLAEREGRRRFAALAEHFRDQPDLYALFTTVEREERFHERYAQKQLQQWRDEDRGAEVNRALLAVRARLAWEAWRRLGRRMGDALATVTLWMVCAVVLWPFAWAQQRNSAFGVGWRERSAAAVSAESEA